MATSSSPHAPTSLTEKIAAKVGNGSEEALNQVRTAARSAAGLRDRGDAAAELTQEVAGTFKSTLNRGLQEQPRVALAAAAILGFVVGALWKLAR